MKCLSKTYRIFPYYWVEKKIDTFVIGDLCLMKCPSEMLQEFFSMAREKDITKPVNFEQISVKAVPPESSDRELSVVLDVGDLLRVAQVYQTSFCHLEAKIFILLGFVLRQGVVHVEAIELYLVQPQGTIDKNPVLVRPALSRAEQAGGWRGRGAWT